MNRTDLDGPAVKSLALRVLELNRESAENQRAAELWQAVAQRERARRHRPTIVERLGWVAVGVMLATLAYWLLGGGAW